jgi:SAM-dependent methyltransferase
MAQLNRHNQHYYLACGTAQVPDLLAVARPVQEALRLSLEVHVLSDPIRVLELGFGSRPDRYLHISARTQRSWQVLLTDFSPAILPPAAIFAKLPHLKLRQKQFNLLTDPFPSGPFDAIVSTYTFDSIDFPQDHYARGLHYPGGLISTVKAALPHLAPGGIFLTLDKTAPAKTVYQTAAGAKFKSLDLDVAAKTLNSQGFAAEFLPLDDFLSRYHQELPLDLTDHGALLVTPRQPLPAAATTPKNP